MAFQKILVHRPNFDDWRLQGVSAYCGGLWLAARGCDRFGQTLMSYPSDHPLGEILDSP